MIVGPGYMDLIHEIAALPAGSTVGLVCASARGAANIGETLAISGTTGVTVIMASLEDEEEAEMADIERRADLILLSREAIGRGLDARFSRTERIREWVYEFDPSGFELLRRAIERARAERLAAAEVAST
jgi:hypothetical protein